MTQYETVLWLDSDTLVADSLHTIFLKADGLERLLSSLFGSDRSPRRRYVRSPSVCVSVCVLYAVEHSGSERVQGCSRVGACVYP